ncbi:Gfo/Idh/MocA family oxidoreductase [Sphingomonas sp. LR61]|uniref:Gfo/Idh/MocA family protein n=1 Tax=Sphingomonas sp. LR61 TaxID=3050234 RepID=UPI002FE20800
MSSDIIRVGLIGGGGIASAHIAGYAEHPDTIRIAAVADAFAATAEERGAELGVPFFTDYLAMLEQADIDAVDICLPHHLHRDAIVAAAKAGKHVLCEKPLCLSPDEAADVQRAVSESGITLMCAHNQLFMPAVAKAKELIDGGALGTVYEVRTTDSFRNEFDPSNMGWRAHASTRRRRRAHRHGVPPELTCSCTWPVASRCRPPRCCPRTGWRSWRARTRRRPCSASTTAPWASS